jgi:hypothetical protein
MIGFANLETARSREEPDILITILPRITGVHAGRGSFRFLRQRVRKIPDFQKGFRMPRFNQQEAEANRRARQILKNPASTLEEKSSARKTIEQLNLERRRRVEAQKSAGKEPRRKDFASDDEFQTAVRDWWAKLDKLAAEREARKVLSEPTSSTLVRTRAYERLGLDPPETLRRDEPVSGTQTENPPKLAIHRLTDLEIAEERRREQKFYDEIAEMLAAGKERGKQL